MKVSKEQMAENHTRILQAASELFRDRGFDAVTVSDVMKAAGLTHGGFYGHFKSKDELVARSIAHCMAHGGTEATDLGTWMEAYLSPHHRDRPATGCPSAGLAGLLRQEAPEARGAMAEGLRHQIDRLADALPSSEADGRTAAIGTWSAMVGAVILARAIDDPELSGEILTRTRAWIERWA